MANLIEQMNTLKGLRDEDLQAELSSPSGSAAPFMVATEIARRKDMRQRYEAEAARRKPSTTVVEDLMAGAQTGLPGAPQGMPAMPGRGMPPAPGFANGGIVDYGDITERYNERLMGLDTDRDRARAIALLTAGAGIMGAGHSNTLQNIGIGAGAGITSYGDALKVVNADEMGLLRGLTDINQLQHQDTLAAMDRDFRERQLAQERDLAEERLTFDRTPADILKFREYQKMTPEENLAYERLNPPYNPNALTNDMRLTDAANEAFDVALKSLPPPLFVEPGKEQQIALERQKQAALLAYPKWVSILGVAAANQKAQQYGVTNGDLLTLNTPMGGTPANGADPLDLGL